MAPAGATPPPRVPLRSGTPEPVDDLTSPGRKLTQRTMSVARPKKLPVEASALRAAPMTSPDGCGEEALLAAIEANGSESSSQTAKDGHDADERNGVEHPTSEVKGEWI